LRQERVRVWPAGQPDGLDVYAHEIRAAEVIRWLLLLTEVRLCVCVCVCMYVCVYLGTKHAKDAPTHMSGARR
jgi:hypothetical protein